MMQMEWCNQFDSRVRIEGAAKHEGRFFNLLVQFQPLLTRPATSIKTLLGHLHHHWNERRTQKDERLFYGRSRSFEQPVVVGNLIDESLIASFN